MAILPSNFKKLNGDLKPETTKVKTAAKKRYLKTKKERKKTRKANNAIASVNGSQRLAAVPAESDHSSYSDPSSPAAFSPAAPEKSQPSEEQPTKAVKKKKRNPTPEVTHQEQGDAAAEDADLVMDDAPPALKQRTPPAPLLSFPLPTAPAPPPAAELALQGLDGALLDAHLVDPNATVAISDDGDGDDYASRDETGLSPRMRKRLRALGIVELFAVQTALLPFLLQQRWRRLYLPYDPPPDVCVSAPTGGGKTLAYVVPIIELLATRCVTQLRALVVLPTRDLVSQVREVFEAVAKGTGLKIAVATGQHSFSHEQAQLIAQASPRLRGGSSKVDVLICTPGRLIDHLTGTPNFTLQHLRFFVIDEADRLITQSFQDWLAQVLAAVTPPAGDAPPDLDSEWAAGDLVAPAWIARVPRTDVDEPRHGSAQKLLFSATLTRDPGKIAALQLHKPQYFLVGAETPHADVFVFPPTLREHVVVCAGALKPLLLLYLLRSRDIAHALVFTKSAEATTRLVRLLDLLGAPAAAAYSSDLPPAARRAALEDFKAQRTSLLVASDLVARGIDVPNVGAVISYDAPVDMRKYVHRVGRTARAGRAGDAWTLVEEQEARWFKEMMAQAGRADHVKRVRIDEKALAPLRPDYDVALQKLGSMYAKGV